MKGKELLDTYPKIAVIIREWFTNKMIESMENSNEVPEEFKNHMKERGMTDDFIINVIDKNPSALFPIFDSLHVYVGISVAKLSLTERIIFNYFICPEGKCIEEEPEDFFSRADVEHFAMLAAVEYINTHLDSIGYDYSSGVMDVPTDKEN